MSSNNSIDMQALTGCLLSQTQVNMNTKNKWMMLPARYFSISLISPVIRSLFVHYRAEQGFVFFNTHTTNLLQK